MAGTLRLALAAGVLAALPLAPAALRAQAAPAAASKIAVSKDAAPDSLAFPRQFVDWIFTTRGDSAFAHAGPRLRESMQSADGVNQMSGRILTRFGEMQGTDAEVQFAEGDLKVYIVAMRFAQAPEPGAFVVAYSPTTKVVERASFGPLANVKGRYPNAKLP
ncbi:hypothetical protein [Roseisolibacter agri]|uniref:Uncharacterized protein n=1 Tax=Roseisolibacter agri TaxID=2014610 RepID=A0AA37VB57_9BACT|nr:hypothetical protein [Roseisolibacter agri]GLC26098.1 hypothetical protein rosag_26110 [Roseisolibacter agri]